MPAFGISVDAAAGLVAGGLASGAACLLVLGSFRRNEILDDTLGGLRKVHAVATPRVGGVAVALGVLGGAVVLGASRGIVLDWLLLVACVAPAFIWGLIEDLSKRGAVNPRLVLPAGAAALAFVLLDARLSQLHIPGVDTLLRVHALAFVVTIFAVTGVTHSINVIDGLNGLAGVTALLACAGLAIVAGKVGDAFIYSAAMVLAGSIGGFLLVNYPSGRLFLGDGGAYLIGLLLAELSVLLVQRNSEVSPWFPPMLLAYPIWETMFSMYRRFTRGLSMARADALHLHFLVYRRLVRWRGGMKKPAHLVARNSITSLCLWPIPAACLAAAVAFWDNSLAIQLAAAMFMTGYTLFYRALVHFRMPHWLVLRVRDPSSLSVDAASRAFP